MGIGGIMWTGVQKAKGIFKPGRKKEKKGGGVVVKQVGTCTILPPEPPCHDGNVLVFTDPVSGLKVYGGGSSRKCKFYRGSMVVIDLNGNYKPFFTFAGMIGKRMSEQAERRVAIDWKDFGAPGLERADWEAILEDIRDEAASDSRVTSVLVCCAGGHGRTGTALAILAGMCKVVPEGIDPIKWVREVYCKKVVESEEQIKYVEYVLGYKSKEGPAKAWTTTQGALGAWVEEYSEPVSYIKSPSDSALWKGVTCVKCGGPKIEKMDTCCGCNRLEKYCVCV
jgi:hypothetical protein